MRQFIIYKAVKFNAFRLNRSREIRRHCRRLFREKCRPEVASDVVCGVAVDQIGWDVLIKLGGGFQSNRS